MQKASKQFFSHPNDNTLSLTQLKVGYVIFQKRFRKPSRGRVPKQNCSQSAVRGVSTHDAEESALISAHDGHQPSDDKDRDGG